MDGILKNKEYYFYKILKWLKTKEIDMDNDFLCDFHINKWIRIESNKDWLDVGITMFNLLRNKIAKYYPNLKVMIAFYLSSTHQTKIPKSITKRNFKKNTYIPPVIFLYSNKIDVKDIMGNDSFFLPEISNKYKIKAYYTEQKEDVVYRTIYMYD